MSLNIPKPPLNADLESLHKHLKDLHTFLNYQFSVGNQSLLLTTKQRTDISKPDPTNKNLKLIGKRVYDTDTNKEYYSYLDGTTLKWKEL